MALLQGAQRVKCLQLEKQKSTERTRGGFAGEAVNNKREDEVQFGFISQFASDFSLLRRYLRPAGPLRVVLLGWTSQYQYLALRRKELAA